ncbi:hypothetical protein SKA34_15843 [Photobacterium sp. SKA34]|nr:hypothetical protein SKA34_15843 [Photobacterium sp. SKA34]
MATAGLCYGTLPAVFPSLTAGFCGLKNTVQTMVSLTQQGCQWFHWPSYLCSCC